jgi:hypothetical protein
LHIADNKRFHKTERLNLFRTHHQYIKRISIFTKGLWNETIINRVMKRRINNTI